MDLCIQLYRTLTRVIYFENLDEAEFNKKGLKQKKCQDCISA